MTKAAPIRTLVREIPRGRKGLRVTMIHVPRPKLAAAIKRMRQGQVIEAASVDDFHRDIEKHRQKLARR